MSNRRIQDQHGTTWDIWDVLPGDVLAGSYDRRTSDRPRVTTPQATPTVQPELENGWLCFQSAGERRRFTPIPADWFGFSDTDLRELLDTATPVAPIRETRPNPLAAE